MTLHPTPVSPVPEETARIARAAVPKGTVHVQMRDVLGSIYSDEQFADLFASRGRPVVPPWRLALVTVMQFAEGLSDRQAAEAVRVRIDWKYALGLSWRIPASTTRCCANFGLVCCRDRRKNASWISCWTPVHAADCSKPVDA